ncbi:MAG: peptide chain release factor N(5)-glutamine methyltransferase [Zoogloeaceae bacterium]|jgi:release factor glutamine methyltransferase|nr:peptide chain release factor N(5)-glutamine methyltransferase [Zoogloeaceae bacterium]
MTVAEWLRAARAQGLDALDARLLLQHVAGMTHSALICRPETPLADAAQATLAQLAARRLMGEPLAYLTGTAGFFGRSFRVSPAVLVPRPETESLAHLALEKLATFQRMGIIAPRVLDLGTGSGALAVTLALECPAAAVTAVDVSPAALAVAAANAGALGATVRFLCSDWFAALEQDARFQVIVANPPYIRAEDEHLAGDGLRFEPRLALTDEGDGLACIRAIVAGAPAFLEEGGWLLFEHGYDQAEDARRLLRAAGFAQVSTQRDLGGQARISGGCREP